MIAVIDNYDSFTYNLVQFLGELVQHMPVHGEHHAEIRVWRNDEIDVEELAELHPTHIVISPGPGSPEKDSGISNDVIRVLGQTRRAAARHKLKARRAGGHRLHRRRRADGHPPQNAADSRRPVSSRKHPDRVWEGITGEFFENVGSGDWRLEIGDRST